MRLIATLSTTVLIALTAAACGSSEPERNADGSMTKAAIDAELAEAGSMRPGQYQATMQVTKFEIPGIPAEQLAQMRGQMQNAMAVQRSYCLTEESARAGRQDMARRLANAEGNCNFQAFDVSGDDISGRMVCTGMPGGGQMEMTMSGTMGNEASDMLMESKMTNPSVPQANAEMSFRVTARRTGECTSAPDASGQ